MSKTEDGKVDFLFSAQKVDDVNRVGTSLYCFPEMAFHLDAPLKAQRRKWNRPRQLRFFRDKTMRNSVQMTRENNERRTSFLS